MTKERILGEDYVVLQGRGGRESTNGASVKGDDKFVHLSVDMGRITICKQAVENFMLTYADVDITCPECIENLKKQ